MATEFRLLGDVEVDLDGRRLDIGPARPRCVLAALLLDANTPVPVAQLIDRVWADRAPQQVRVSLQSHLTRLRGALAATDAEIVRRGDGYLLAVDEHTVDVHRFRQLVRQARASGDDGLAASLLAEALDRWHGEPFGALDTPWLATVRATLTDERHAARLDLVDHRLHRGDHAVLLPELIELARTHPWDERIAGQLMLALYRSGRPADALRSYEDVRLRLADELGTDPSPPLRDLHQRILTFDPALAGQATRSTPRPPVPRQLPAPPRWFTGRTGELDRLTSALDVPSTAGTTIAISAIGGAGGAGKTWLALHWAHRHLDRFPDGQLWVNLRGFDPSGQPLTPQAAIRILLDALGVEPAAIPADLDAQLGLYRGLVAGRRMLILLDNAADTAQVAPLLPGSPTCTVLVTSRDRLAGLVTSSGAHPVALEVFPDQDARALLADRLGDERMAAEPDPVAELVACCAGLPLALGIVAGRAQTHPELPLSALAADLRDATTRLAGLATDPSVSVRAVLSWSHAALTPAQARVFGLLGRVPGPDISRSGAANLTGLTDEETLAALRALERVALVQQHVAGRYRMHDLVRLYAAEQAVDDESTAARRLIHFYLHTAAAADRVISPRRSWIDLGEPVPGCRPDAFDDDAAAVAWFEPEHACVLAALRSASALGWHREVFRLAWALGTFHWRRGHMSDDLVVWEVALDSALRLADPFVLARAHRLLGHGYAHAGRYDEAMDHFKQSTVLTEQLGDRVEEGHTHYAMTQALALRGDDRAALEHGIRALRLFETADAPLPEAQALNAVGYLSARLGRYDEARTACERALALQRRHHDRASEVETLDSLGYIAHHTSRFADAIDYYQQAMRHYDDLGDSFGAASSLEALGHLHADQGHRTDARDTWQRALHLYQSQHRTADAQRIQRRLLAP
jgi:DNA-binding SARP family transcriptional activator/tetratricopeptide (TPR) repeat protein